MLDEGAVLMARFRFLCRCGTGPSGCGALIAACSALVGACSFTDFSGTTPPDPNVREPACPAWASDAGDLPVATPVAHWSFNSGSSNGSWTDVLGRHALIASNADPLNAGGVQSAAHPRINGEGQSIAFGGQQHLQSADAAEPDLFSDALTLSVWLSLPTRAFSSDHPYPLFWPLISAMSPASECRGYELGLRYLGADQKPELVFTYQRPSDGDAGISECLLQSLSAEIEVPSWATGTGRWHHAASVSTVDAEGRRRTDLYWDERLVRSQSPLEPEVATSMDGSVELTRLMLGASPILWAGAKSTVFTGYLDEVAVFNQALDAAQLARFTADSTTRLGPANCRWRAIESWDETKFDASTADWSPGSTPQNLSLAINDYDWGAGAIDAQLAAPKNLQLYSKAVLRADIPNDRAFQFTLASGDSYCTWAYLGRGDAEYEIDLRHPLNCVSTSCELRFDHVDRASVTSEWSIPDDSSARSTNANPRREGPETFTIRGLDFVVARDQPSWAGYGGARGPMGWCWRLQAYEPQTNARWAQTADQWSTSISAFLNGPTYSGTRIVADFGERPLDISHCQSISVTATVEPRGLNSKHALVIQDVYGSWVNWNIVAEKSPFVFALTNPSISSATELYSALSPSPVALSGKPTSNFANFPPVMRLDKVRLIGIQKPWTDNERNDYQVTISNVEFQGPDGRPGCEIPGSN